MPSIRKFIAGSKKERESDMTRINKIQAHIFTAFAAAKNGETGIIERYDGEWEMVCDMAYQNGFETKGMMHWPGEGMEPCDISSHGDPESIQVEGNTVSFLYF